MEQKRKLSVIFAEDEKIIRDALISEIDWDSLDVGVLLEAEDAEALFALMQVNKVDLVFMDINMPRINGIEASRILKEKNPDVHIIILTSYNDFEYVREALRLGVDEYLLKPVNKEEIRTAVQIVQEKIRKKEENSHQLDNMIEKSKVAWKQTRYQELLYEKETNLERIREIGEEGDSICSNYVQVASFCVKKSSIQDQAIGTVKKRIENFFSSMSWVTVLEDRQGNIVVLNTSWQMLLEEKCREILADFEKAGEKVYIGLSNIHWNMAEMSEAYYESRKALEYRAVFSWNSCICYDDIEMLGKTVIKINTDQFKPIEMAIRLGNEKSAVNLLQEMWKTGDMAYGLTVDILHSQAAVMMTQILKLAEFYNIWEDVFEKENENLYRNIYLVENVEDMLELFQGYIHAVVNKIMENIGTDSRKYLKDVEAYINANIKNPKLSLTMLAEHFYMNASYLSRVLKEYLGCNFSDYCCKKRIELAMKLLPESDRKAYEIAYEVGFSDAKYFGACFKKITGITVNDYRKSNKENQHE